MGNEDTQMPAGRPPKYNTPEDIEEIGTAYFAECQEKEIPPTMSGLALALGFIDRRSVYDYEKRPQYSHAIKLLRTHIETHWEQRLGGNAVTGAIFWLKNHDWKDERQVDNTHRFDIASKSDEELRRIIEGEDA